MSSQLTQASKRSQRTKQLLLGWNGQLKHRGIHTHTCTKDRLWFRVRKKQQHHYHDSRDYCYVLSLQLQMEEVQVSKTNTLPQKGWQTVLASALTAIMTRKMVVNVFCFFSATTSGGGASSKCVFFCFVLFSR